MHRAAEHANQPPLDENYFFSLKSGQLAYLTLFLPLHDRFPFLLTDCKRFCKPSFGNTKASCLTFLLLPLSPHSPYTPNPHFHLSSFWSWDRSLRVPTFWAGLGGWAERELRILCWKVLTATIKWFFHLQAITELGLLTRCKGLPLSLMSSFCIPDRERCHQLESKTL